MISREMNSIEIEVLNLIVNRASFEEPITALDIRKEAGLAPYRRQILTEQKNLSIVMAVDLEKYWNLEHD